MKLKTILPAIIVGLTIGGFSLGATILFPSGGGTGTGTNPKAGQVLIGTSGGVYSPVWLTAGTNITIATTSGGITINSTATGGGGGGTWATTTGLTYILTDDIAIGANSTTSATFSVASTTGVITAGGLTLTGYGTGIAKFTAGYLGTTTLGYGDLPVTLASSSTALSFFTGQLNAASSTGVFIYSQLPADIASSSTALSVFSGTLGLASTTGTLTNDKIASSSEWATYNYGTANYVSTTTGLTYLTSALAAQTYTASNTISSTYFTIANADASNTAWLADTKWDGGNTDLVPATGRTSLELGDSAVLASSTFVKWADASTTNWSLGYVGYVIVNASSSNWDLAYGWGDHASAGYATTGTTGLANYYLKTYTDVNYVASNTIGTLTNTKWCSSDGSQITCTENAPAGGGVESLNELTGALTLWGTSPLTVAASGTVGLVLAYTEADPIWTASSSLYASSATPLTFFTGNLAIASTTGTLGYGQLPATIASSGVAITYFTGNLALASTTGTLSLASTTGTLAIASTTGTIAYSQLPASIASSSTGIATFTGTLGIASTTGTIGVDRIAYTNATTDEYYLTYEEDDNSFEWVVGSGGGVTSLNTLDGALTLWGTANQVTITASGTVGLIASIPNDLYVGADDTATGSISIFGDNASSGGYLRMYNSADNDDQTQYWQFTPSGAGDTSFTLGIDDDVDLFKFYTAGNFTALGNVAGATYGSDASVSDTELKYINTLSSNAQTQLTAIGGWASSSYAWATSAMAWHISTTTKAWNWATSSYLWATTNAAALVNNATTGSAITGFAGILAYNHGGTGTSTALASQYLWWGDGAGNLVQVASSTLAGAGVLSGGQEGFVPYWTSESALGTTSISYDNGTTTIGEGDTILSTDDSGNIYFPLLGTSGFLSVGAGGLIGTSTNALSGGQEGFLAAWTGETTLGTTTLGYDDLPGDLASSSTALSFFTGQLNAASSTGVFDYSQLPASIASSSTALNVFSGTLNFASTTGTVELASTTLGALASTTGNLIVGSSTVWAVKAIGTDGYVLTASTTAPGGLGWQALPATSLTGGTANYMTYWVSDTTIGTSTGLTVSNMATTGIATLSSLSSIGTITTGVWNGTDVDEAYLDSDIATTSYAGFTWASSSYAWATSALASINATGTTNWNYATTAYSWASSSWVWATATAAKIGTITDTKWCSASGTAIYCTEEAPAGGGVTTLNTLDGALTIFDSPYITWAASGTEGIVSTMASTSNYNLAYSYGSAFNSSSSNYNLAYQWATSAQTYLAASSSNYNLAYTYGSYFNSSSSNYNTAYGYLTASSSNWNTAYGILNASSSNYNKAYAWATSSETWHGLFTASTTNWDTAYGKVNASSSNWDLGYGYGAIYNASSSNYDKGFQWATTSYGWATTTAAKIGTLTNTKWCSTDGSKIDCTEEPPAGGGVTSLNELDGALTLWGTTNQLTVTASGTVGLVLSTPQDIHTGASPTFAGLTLSDYSGVAKFTAGVLGTTTLGYGDLPTTLASSSTALSFFTGNLAIASTTGALNISTQSNIVAGRSLSTSTAGTIDADAELYTKSGTINFVNNTTTAAARRATYKPSGAITITEVGCYTNGGTSNIGLYEAIQSTPNASSSKIVDNLTCDSDSASTTSFGDAAIASGNFVGTYINSIAGASSTIVWIEYTEDD